MFCDVLHLTLLLHCANQISSPQDKIIIDWLFLSTMHRVTRMGVVLGVSILPLVNSVDDTMSRALNGAPTISPQEQYSCTGKYDAPDKFELDGFAKKKSCDWVRRRRTAERCRIPMVINYCPITCGLCPKLYEPTPSPINSGTIDNDQEIASSNYYGDRDNHDKSGKDGNDSFLIIVVSTMLGGFALMIGAVALVIRKRKRIDVGSIVDDGSLSVSNDLVSSVQSDEFLSPKRNTRQELLNLEKGRSETSVGSLQSSRCLSEHLNEDRDHISIDIQNDSSLTSDDYESYTFTEYNQSSTFSGKATVWSRRMECDNSFDTESKTSTLSDFVLPSVYETSHFSDENGTTFLNTQSFPRIIEE